MEFKKTAQIKDELFNNGWRDDTLSPLAEEPYWKLCKEMIPQEEKVVSVLFAKSLPTSLIQKKFIFIITEDAFFYRSDYGGYISKPKKIAFSEIMKVKLFEDRYLPSFIYIDIQFSWIKTLHLQTFDPTGLFHFENILRSKKG